MHIEYINENVAGFDCITLGAYEQPPEARKRIVVLCHGVNANNEDMAHLATGLMFGNALAKDTVFVTPNAPLVTLVGAAYAWWEIDWEAFERAMQSGEPRIRRDNLPEDLPKRGQELNELVSALCERYQLNRSQVYLGGFSQGSMLAVEASLMQEEPIAGMLLFSSTLLCQDRWRGAATKNPDVPVFQSHGTNDVVLRIEEAEALRDLLRETGHPVEWQTFVGEHDIGENIVSAAAAFLIRDGAPE